MRPFLTVYGHVCLDQILDLERFPEPNTSVDIREKHRYFGGRTLGSRTPDPGTSKSFDLCEWVATSAKR